MGNIASSLIDEGVKLGVSSRGVGSLAKNNEGVNVVGEDFQLATACRYCSRSFCSQTHLWMESWKEKLGLGRWNSS